VDHKRDGGQTVGWKEVERSGQGSKGGKRGEQKEMMVITEHTNGVCTIQPMRTSGTQTANRKDSYE